LSVEEKIAKIKEILGDDEKALDAYIKQKGYHNDPAWQKQRELIDRLKKESTEKSTLSQEDTTALEEFKKFRSSPEYIQMTMKSQGYTQEAIDKKLQESGFNVTAKAKDDIQLVFEKLGINTENMTPEAKANVTANVDDVVKIMNVILDDRLSKIIPKELAPIKSILGSVEQKDNASKLMSIIQNTVKAEAILDFAKDIEPALNKFLDENPDATQQDVFEHFKHINHELTLGRLKTGNKQAERDDKKNNNRPVITMSKGTNGISQKTGNFDKDADAFFDSVNFKE